MGKVKSAGAVKPCPFCGGEGRVVAVKACGGMALAVVVCRECGVAAQAATAKRKAEAVEFAVLQWNARPGGMGTGWPWQRCPECADGRPARFGEVLWDVDGVGWVVLAVGPAVVAAHPEGMPKTWRVLAAHLLSHSRGASGEGEGGKCPGRE